MNSEWNPKLTGAGSEMDVLIDPESVILTMS